MKTKIVSLIIAFVAFNSHVSLSQNLGFMGKKNIVDLGILANGPFITNNLGEIEYNRYHKNSGQVKKSRDILDLAYQINYTRCLNNNISFGLGFGYQNVDVGLYYDAVVEYYDTSFQDHFGYQANVEHLDFKYSYIIPRLEIRNKNNIFGVGITHQFGLGWGFSSLRDKEYHMDFYNYNHPNDGIFADLRSNFYDYSNNSFKFLICEYALSFRKPISKSLMLNYGFRYNITWQIQQKYFSNKSNFIVSNNDVSDVLSSAIGFNIIQFRFGLSYVF